MRNLYQPPLDLKAQSARLNQIPIRTVASWLGVNLPSRGSALCPFPDHKERNPSFAIGRSGVRWECYSCNRKGGSIDFVMTFKNVEFAAAKQWLLRHEGSSSIDVADKVARRQRATKSSEPKSPEVDTEIYETFMSKCSLRSGGLSYLQGRGFSSNTIAHFRVGQLSEADATLPDLIDQFGFERVHACGLLTERSTASDARLAMPDGYLLFPFVERGRVVSLQARICGDHSERRKWINLLGHARRAYNVDALLSNTREVGICEGIPDTISAHELGIPAIGLLGVSARLEPAQLQLMCNRSVSILLDWDSPGERRAQELRQELSARGIPSIRRARPEIGIKDLNEYLMYRRRGTNVAI